MISRCAVLFLVLAARAAADDSTIVTAANASIVARDVALVTEDGELLVKYTDTAGSARAIKAADVVEIIVGQNRTAPNPHPAADDVEIFLTTGDLLTGKVGAKSPDGVQLVSKSYGDPLVKFGQIRAILFPANSAYRPKTPPEKVDEADIVFNQSGDRALGAVLSVSSAGVVYNSRKLGEQTVPLAKAVGIWLTPDPTQKPPKEPASLFETVLTSDGSSLRGQIESLREGVLSFKDLYGIPHKVAANLVSGIYMKNGRVVYLSDIQPAAVEEDPNFIRGPQKMSSDLEYPFQRDKSAKGTKIILGGVEHRKGLGVRAHSALTYSLGGAFKRFQATLGMDAAARDLGAILAEVWVDGKKVKELPLQWSDAVQPLDLDVSGAKELKLVVTWAGSGQSDFADWGSARLIR